MAKICVIGSLNMDMVINTPRIPVLGETLHGGGFMTAPGGKGANQAVAAARLGGDVTMVGCVGDDIFGSALLDNLSANGVNIENVKSISKTPTGVAVIVIKDGDNYIILDSGANYHMTPLQLEYIEDIIKESDIVLLQLEVPQDVVEKAVDLANKNNVKVVLNPAPARQLSDSLLSKVDIFIPNETECGYYAGKPIDGVEDAKEAIRLLMGKGVKQVIVTMGEKGVLYTKGKEISYKPAVEVEAVDTTAAGDSFIGAFAVKAADGNKIDEVIDFATAVAALAVTKKGAQTSLPTLDEVREFQKTL